MMLVALLYRLCIIPALALLALATPPRAAEEASCIAGPNIILVERGIADEAAWHCLGTYHQIGELQAVLARGSQGAQRLRITIGPGRYSVGQPLVLDGAQLKGIAVEISGTGDDRSTIVGSIPVGSTTEAWTQALDAVTVKRYLETNHSSQATSTPHDLLFYDGDDRVVPGRWPAKGWGEIVEATRNGDLWRLRLADASGQPAQLAPGPVRLSGFPGFDWAYMSLPAQAISADTVTVSATALHYPAKVRQRITLEAAHSPNADPRIAVDPAAQTVSGPSGKVYAWARAWAFIQVTGMANLRIEKLALMGFAGDAITIARSSDVTLDHLTLSQIGGRGVVITGGKRILVNHADMRFMGEGGVDAGGGDRITLEPSEITISNSNFERFSEIVMGYRPAVWLHGVGSRVIDNRMHDAPHSALIFEGNEHVIQGNTIYNVVNEVRDSGAILAGRDWTTYGTVIDANVFAHLHPRQDLPSNGVDHDINSVRGIYLDDFTSGIEIKNNIFFQVDFGIFLNGGSDVHVHDNFFVQSSLPFAIFPWGMSRPRETFDANHRAVAILTYLRQSSSKLFQKYSRLDLSVDALLVPRNDQFIRNVLIDSSEPTQLRGDTGLMNLSNPGGTSLQQLQLPDPSIDERAKTRLLAIVDAVRR